jgi:hypothetical protein
MENTYKYFRRFTFFVVLCISPIVLVSQIRPIDIACMYYFGDGLGDQATLVLNSDSTFILERSYDVVGVPKTKRSGIYSIVRGHIILFPNWLNIVSYAGGIHTHYIPIEWGKRRYLIPDEEMIDFCNEINLGREPRESPNGTFFLREGDWVKIVSGFPELQGSWINYLLPEPISGKIIELTEYGHAKVNLGNKNHVCTDMKLVVQWDDKEESQLMNLIVPVVRVADDYCIIRSDSPKSFWIGAKVTSRFKPSE